MADPVSSSTHLLTAFVAIFATLFLYQLTQGFYRRLSVLVFGFSMILLYASSGLYHAFRLPYLQKIDRSAIYAFIAGTYTPIMAILLKGQLRRALLIGMWSIAATGISCLWIFPKPPYGATVGLYLGMGWLGLMGVVQYYRATGMRGMTWAIAGSCFYTFGAVCELAQWPVIVPGVVQAHEVLHISIMAATACHYIFILRYVVAYNPEANRLEPAQRADTEMKWQPEA